MKNTYNKIKEILNKFDTFSKLLFLLIIIVSIYAVYSLFPQSKERDTNNPPILEVSDYKEFTITDYNFYTYGKDRTPEDDYLMVNFSKPLTPEEKSKLSYKVIPEENLSVEYGNLNNAVIKFSNPSKADNSVSKFLILYEGKQLFSFEYLNTNKVPEAEYIIRELNKK